MPAIQLMLLKIELRKRTPVPVAEDLIAKHPGKGCGKVEAPIRQIQAKPIGEIRGRAADHGVIFLGNFAIPIYIPRSEEHTSELQSLMRISYAVFLLKKK